MLSSRFARYVGSVGVLGVVGALVAAAGNAGAVSPAAAGGTVETQVYKSVSQSGTASGEIGSGTLVTQVHAVGNGTMNVQVPVGASSSRNLNGFGGAQIQGNSIVLNQQVNGSVEQRYMTTTNEQPIKVHVTATLDGKSIKPEDIVGKSGVLEVKYLVTNTTVTKKQISFNGPDGQPMTKEVELTQPFAGTLSVTLPSEFSEVHAPGASLAGDSENNTTLGYSMVLFPPLGKAQAELTYQARVTGGSLPSASFDFLPIKPYSNPVLASTKEKLDGAEALGNQIYDIGDGVNAGAIQLTDDASQLLATLTSAVNNAQDLADGLRDNLGAKAQRTADTASSLWAEAKGSGGMVPAAKAVISDINDLNDALTNIMDTIEDVPAIASIFNLIEALDVETSKMAGYVYAPSPTSVRGNVTSLQGNGACDATCQAAVTAISTDLDTIASDTYGTGTPTNPSELKLAYLTNMVAEYLPMIASISSLITSQPLYQELLDGRSTLQNEIVDNFTQTCSSCFSHLVSGSQELASDLFENAATAQEDVTTLQNGITEGPDAMISGMQELQTEGVDQLHQEGSQTIEEYGAEVAQLNALQQMAEEGQNVPYGNATGSNTTTAAVYQLTLAGAAGSGKTNAINYLLGIILFIVAGAVGTVAWRKRKEQLS